jgi:solute carrier family 35 protein
MVCSAGMMIINKMVLRSLPLPMTVVTIQMATTVIALVTTSSSLHFGSVRDVLRWATTIPLLFTFMLASSMLALDLASMGAIVVVRNVAPIITLAMERAVSEHIELDAPTILSMLVIIGGVVLYTFNDIQFSAAGLALMGFNMISSVVERVLQRKMIAVSPIDVSKTGMMLLNNAVALVPMSLLLVAFGEPARWHVVRSLRSWDWTLLAASCVNAVAISWAGINAQAYVTATTFMVLTNVNKFAVVGFGIFVLGEARSWQAISGCLIALGGGLWYARARSQIGETAKQRAAYAAQAQEAADDADEEAADSRPMVPRQ